MLLVGVLSAVRVLSAETLITVQAHPDPKPNIIFVLSDDIGWMDWKIYNPGSNIPSPNIDRLAQEGMRFMDAHSTSALCAPSRYSVLTGNYPWRGRKPGGTWSWMKPSQILPGQKTVGKLMQETGYRTAIIGNLHQGGDWSWKDSKPDFTRPMKVGPKEWGFDYSYVLISGHQEPPYMFFENGKVAGNPADIIQYDTGDYGVNKDISILTPGPGLPDWDPHRIGETLVEKSIAFIEQKNDKPFYLYLAVDGSHFPYAPPKAIMGTRVAGVTHISPHTDMIYEVDVVVGKLLEALQKSHLDGNTIVVVTSDNGANIEDVVNGQDSNRGLHGGKSYIWEGGHRVPLVVWWPGHIKPGVVSQQLIGIHDMVPTFVELGGGKPAADQMLDSTSFASLLTGERNESQPVRDSLLVDSGIGRYAGTESELDTRILETIELRHATQKRWDEISQGQTRNSRALTSDFLQIPKQDVWTTQEDREVQIAQNNAWINATKNSASDGMSHALREGSWKLVFDLQNDKPVALYKLDDDLAEMHNLINDASQQLRIARMTQDYHDLRTSKRSTRLP